MGTRISHDIKGYCKKLLHVHDHSAPPHPSLITVLLSTLHLYLSSVMRDLM